MTNSRAKGIRGEREFANLLRERGHEARRGQQYEGSSDSPDVITDMDRLHFEVKRVEKFRMYEALKQARSDARAGAFPVVAHRSNGESWVAVLSMVDFLTMYEVLEAHNLLGVSDL